MPTCEELGYTAEECAGLDPAFKAAQGITESTTKRLPPTSGPSTLSQLVGSLVLDPGRGYAGVLKSGQFGSIKNYYIETASGRKRVDPGHRLYDPYSNTLFSVGARTTDANGRVLPDKNFFTESSGLSEKERARILSQFGLASGTGTAAG